MLKVVSRRWVQRFRKHVLPKVLASASGRLLLSATLHGEHARLRIAKANV